MKNFKQILSIIAEAKLELGGKDFSVLFGPNGPFSPNKGIKEPSAETPIKEVRPAGFTVKRS